MASKSTLRRQKSAGKVAASGRTHKKLMSEAMGGIFGEEIIKPVDTVVDMTADHLESKSDAMVKADDAHLEELRDDTTARDGRDEDVDAAHDEVVTNRAQLTTIMGDKYVARLGFEGDTPEEPLELARVVGAVVTNLTKIPAPEPLIEDYTFNPSKWAAKISKTLGKLEGAVAEVNKEVREAEATLSAKNDAIEDYDRAFSVTANLFSALLDAAGKKDLAKKVRPSTRRAGQTVEDAAKPDPTI